LTVKRQAPFLAERLRQAKPFCNPDPAAVADGCSHHRQYGMASTKEGLNRRDNIAPLSAAAILRRSTSKRWPPVIIRGRGRRKRHRNPVYNAA
jgi:hypothetical protein